MSTKTCCYCKVEITAANFGRAFLPAPWDRRNRVYCAGCADHLEDDPGEDVGMIYDDEENCPDDDD